MARARMLKPGFFRNETLCELSHATRLLYAGLWGSADREGRLEDRPKRIAADVFPYEHLDVNAMLDELDAAGFIVRYVVDSTRYIAIPKFLDHQRPHVREAPSIIPAPTLDDPRRDLGRSEGDPGSPVTKSESVLKSESVTVSETERESGAGPGEGEGAPKPRANGKPAGDEKKLLETARQVLKACPNEDHNGLIDQFQWVAKSQHSIDLNRKDATQYLQRAAS